MKMEKRIQMLENENSYDFIRKTTAIILGELARIFEKDGDELFARIFRLMSEAMRYNLGPVLIKALQEMLDNFKTNIRRRQYAVKTNP